jgi:hypothetical protein
LQLAEQLINGIENVKDLEMKISWIILFIAGLAGLITDLYFNSKKAFELSPYKISALRSYVQWQSREGLIWPSIGRSKREKHNQAKLDFLQKSFSSAA